MIELEALDDPAPPGVRLRRWLKLGWRAFRLKVVSAAPVCDSLAVKVLKNPIEKVTN